MRTSGPVGRYEIALLNGEKIALHGNIKLGIFAGLSMGSFVRARCRKAGRKRRNYADNVKYFD